MRIDQQKPDFLALLVLRFPTLRAVTIILLLLSPTTPARQPDVGARAFSIAVVPQSTPLQLHKDWKPFLERVSRDSAPLLGYLLVRQDSSAAKVQDLVGKKVAFPAPNAFAASLYMRALLAGREHTEVVPDHVTRHSNVIRHVLLGQSAAGGVSRSAYPRDYQPLELLFLDRHVSREGN